MERRVLVHFGVHKAGSTYLQVLLSINLQTLEANGTGVRVNLRTNRCTKHSQDTRSPV